MGCAEEKLKAEVIPCIIIIFELFLLVINFEDHPLDTYPDYRSNIQRHLFKVTCNSLMKDFILTYYSNGKKFHSCYIIKLL